MLSLQKFNKFRERSMSPKFRFSCQPQNATISHSHTHAHLLSNPDYKPKHFHYHSEISSLKFRYLHKIDWQKLQKKYDIVEKRIRISPKQSPASAQNAIIQHRQRVSSTNLRFQFMPLQDCKVRAKEEMAYCKSKSLSSKSKLQIKRKLQYRLNEHKKFVAEFGTIQGQVKRLQSFKKNRDNLLKKPMKRIVTFHKVEHFFD